MKGAGNSFSQDITSDRRLKKPYCLFQIVSPIDTFHVSGRLASASNGIYRYTGEARCNHNTLRGELTLASSKSADLKIYYDNSKYTG